jgi:hypothetical protein
MKLSHVRGYLSLAILAALYAFSAASAKASASDYENVMIVKRPSVIEESSEHNRMGKSFYLSVQPVGFAVSIIPSEGIDAGYYLNRNSLLQLEYSKGKGLDYVFFDVEATTVGLNLKYFTGNSFYLKGGAEYRQVSITNFHCLFCDSNTKSDLGSADSIGVELAIGNQWQWSNFTLGCDWLGATIPVATTKISNSYKSDPDFSSSSKSDLDNAWNQLARTTSYELLRFYLGASF